MRRLTMCSALLLAGIVLAGPATAEQSFRDAVTVALGSSAPITEKSVPRGDKSTADVVGPILAGLVVTDYQCTGASVVLLWVRVGPNPVSAVCSTAACGALRVGQRVRLQGALVSEPDVEDPGFDPCDRSTWIPGISNVFVATKITK